MENNTEVAAIMSGREWTLKKKKFDVRPGEDKQKDRDMVN